MTTGQTFVGKGHGYEFVFEGLPARLRAHLDNRTVPAHAKRHPGDVHVWEQDGYLVHVTRGAEGRYLPQVTKLSSDRASNDTVRWFMLEQGLPPREAWKAFVDRL